MGGREKITVPWGTITEEEGKEGIGSLPLKLLASVVSKNVTGGGGA